MIKLDYQTRNPRWGLSGLKYTSWINYAFAMGYLANVNHYHDVNKGLIELRIEHNEKQGAWNKEGRIHYYGSIPYIDNHFHDWYVCSSAGRNKITLRINSNGFINSLVNDYGFVVKQKTGKKTGHVFPPDVNAYNTVLTKLLNSVAKTQKVNSEDLQKAFKDGWDLR